MKATSSSPVEPETVVTPEALAELGISGKSLRAWLRRQYPRSPVEHGQRWSLTDAQVAAARQHWWSR